MEYESHEHDVLVIGAGGAGLRAAIECSAQGLSVGLVCKSLLGKAHTVMAEGGIAAALANVDARDGWQVHFRDTMRGGKFLNQWRMAQLHAQESPARVKELEGWGALFDRTEDGRILQRNFGGHKYPRLAHVGDRTGLEMIRTLQQHGVHLGMSVYMECNIQALLKDGERISGAAGYWRDNGRIVVFRAKAIVLATGGVGRSYKITSNSWEYTGDGHALAYQAGAELLDMEFLQFHPTGMIWPPSVRGILVTEGVRGDGGTLRNKEGKRFMFGYIPPLFAKETADTEEEADRWVHGDKAARRTPDLLTRDVVARAINAEVKAGRGSPHGGAFLDIATRRDPAFIKKKLPSMYHQFKQLANVDITTEAMEVGPTTHYIMGGVRVHPETQESRVPGLFAAGECAGGMHGANRLGGNSLSDLLVFGQRAGAGAADYARKLASAPTIDEGQVEATVREFLAPFDNARKDGENPYTIAAELQETMQSLVGIIRSQAELEQADVALSKLEARAKNAAATAGREYNPGWHMALDLRNMLICSRAIQRAALMRPESRGAHTREEFPDSDKAWGTKNIVIRKKGDEMELVTEPLPEMPEELKKLLAD